VEGKIMRTLILVTVVLLVLAACQAEQLDEPTTPVEKPGAAQSGTTAGEVQANDITIAYESFGSPQDETILLIAGTGQQLTGWPMALVEALVERG
jgi:ABC-type glycerol-3-phosphate transport system substrate-binding protein